MSAREFVKAAAQPKRGRSGAHGHYDEDGIWWPSDIEELHWKGTLKPRERAGEITDLERQIRFPLHAVNGEFIGEYVADAGFFDRVENRRRIQDVKSDRYWDTDLFKWKARHMKAQYGIEVECVRIKSKRRVKPWK